MAAAGREAPLATGGSLTLETAGVMDGGEHHGLVGRALLYLDGAAGTDALGLWNGGRIYVSGAFIRHRGPIDVAGDVQGASNIAAPRAARLYEGWYSQNLASVGLRARAGVIDLNRYFVVTDDAGNLLNSSFGIMPTITGNLPTPIFPEPGCGAMAELTRKHWTNRVGIFQGDPGRRFEPLNNGRLAIAETSWRKAGGQWTGGIWDHTKPAPKPGETWGYYVLVQHPLGARRLKGFLQFGQAFGSSTTIPIYLGAGVDFRGPIAGRPDDHLVLGIARASIRDAHAETSYEVGYKIRLNGMVAVQPDLQYISHPSGTGRNSVVAFLRLGLTFD